jgi:microcystin-dependent protein
MSTPYIGEIRIFGFNFAPYGWAFCDGSPLSISNNDALFNLIGTTYGGDGINTFALPDLRGRVPVHTGGTLFYVQGQSSGTENVTLLANQLPAHTHAINAEGAAGTAPSAVGGYFAGTSIGNYGASASSASGVFLQAGTANQSQPHNNIQPYLTINYSISLVGVFPSQN